MTELLSKEDFIDEYESYSVMTDADHYEDLWPKSAIEDMMEGYTNQEIVAYERWRRSMGIMWAVGPSLLQSPEDLSNSYQQYKIKSNV